MEVLPLRGDIQNTELVSVLGFLLFSQIMAVFVETFCSFALALLECFRENSCWLNRRNIVFIVQMLSVIIIFTFF